MRKVFLFLFLFSFSIYVSAQVSLPYLEDFTGEDGQGAVGPTPTTNTSSVDWTVDVSAASLSSATDWFQVQNEVMEARDTDGEVIWTSPTIDVSGLTSTVNLSVDFSEDGNHESADYAQAYYSLDGAAAVLFSTNGNNTDDFTAATAEHSLTFSSNTSLTIIIKMKNNVGSELLRFNNVSVQELAPCAEPMDQPTALVLSPEATSISGSFTEAVSSPDNYIVVVSTSSTLSASPVDGMNYDIGDPLGGGTIVTKTSINSFVAENLTQGTLYYFFVFSLNSKCTGNIDYKTTAELTGNIATITVPDIIITEIMLNPSTSSDALGEYFEIYNNSGADVDINGWIIKDNGSNNHTINHGAALTITNGGFLILGKNRDLGTNGNVTVDYEITSGFTLTNTDDEIILQNTSGIEIDRVEYDGGTGFPNPTNASMYLTNIDLDNNTGSNWATSTTSEGGITPDKGSPGVIGETSLPVELISFRGEKANTNVQLTWKTATEINNDYFIIQRSMNGKTFENIGEVQGFGTTTETQSYSFIDPTPANGANYYRLKQVDFDEKFDYSNIINIEMKRQSASIDVYPNPSTGYYNIKISNDWTSQTNLDVFDMTGRLVFSKKILNNASELNLAHLPNGNYFLKFTNQSDVLTTRIVKMQ